MSGQLIRSEIALLSLTVIYVSLCRNTISEKLKVEVNNLGERT